MWDDSAVGPLQRHLQGIFGIHTIVGLMDLNALQVLEGYLVKEFYIIFLLQGAVI